MNKMNKYEEALYHLILKLGVALRDEYLKDENITKCLKELSELVKHCDALEEDNERLNKELIFVDTQQTPDYKRVQTELQRCQKALLKTCSFIENHHLCPKELFEDKLKCCCKKLCKERKYDKTECWKEWAFKDE